jgi:predicted nucleic acid-binding protein
MSDSTDLIREGPGPVSGLVVDASVVIRWFLPEALAEAALRVAASDRAFLGPELLGAEFANTL